MGICCLVDHLFRQCNCPDCLALGGKWGCYGSIYHQKSQINCLLVGHPSFGVGTVICGAPVAAVFSVIGFAIGAALVQWVAKLFGGTGSFEKLAYAFSAITVPYSVVTAVLTTVRYHTFCRHFDGLNQFCFEHLFNRARGICCQSSEELDTGKAVGAVLLPGIAIFLLICCCVVLGAAFLVPLFRSTSGSAFLGFGGF